MKPYYQDDAVTIYHGDCRDILPHLPKVDLVLTDPPYGIGLDHHNAERGRGYRPYTPTHPARSFSPVFGDNEHFNPSLWITQDAILWGANHYASRLPDSHCWLVWDRKVEKAAASDITDCELAWTKGLSYKTVRMFRHMWAGYQRDSEVGQTHLHPTQKPVALMKWCLLFFPAAATILDPFMGSGTTLRAAKDLGRKAIGIEIKEEYCEIAAKRMSQSVMELKL